MSSWLGMQDKSPFKEKERLTLGEASKLGWSAKGNKWYPTDPIAVKYIEENGYREPSWKWPLSYLRPLTTKKFYKYFTESLQNNTTDVQK